MTPPESKPGAKPEQPRVRLLKIAVQPTFVVDDGEHLEEVEVRPIPRGR